MTQRQLDRRRPVPAPPAQLWFRIRKVQLVVGIAVLVAGFALGHLWVLVAGLTLVATVCFRDQES